MKFIFMRSIYKNIFFLLIAFVMAGTFISCSDDDLSSGGKPMISYIRVTNPDASDSLLVSAGQGSMIAIIGQNLGGVRELWINNRQASLTPTLITDASIITRVPSQIPTEINNMMKLIFGNGDSLMYDFTVNISEPLISYLESEYVNEGDIAVIRGNYFYAPITITFSGGAEGEVVSLEDDMVRVRVPEGAEPGPIVVTTNFGESKSDFWFRDNRNIIASFDGSNFEGWWHGKDYIVASDPDITPINNKFLRINRELGAWAWFEMWVGNGIGILEDTKNIPAGAFANPEEYSMKFEIYTLAPLAGAEIRMYMGPNMSGEREGTHYNWKPNLDAKDAWQTVVIPFDEFVAGNPTLEYNPNGYEVSFHFSGPLAVHANFGLDNIRVVPNK